MALSGLPRAAASSVLYLIRPKDNPEASFSLHSELLCLKTQDHPWGSWAADLGLHRGPFLWALGPVGGLPAAVGSE